MDGFNHLSIGLFPLKIRTTAIPTMENNNPSSIEILFEKAENYGKTTIELAKLNVIDKSAEVVSSLVTQLAVAIVLSMCVLTTNIGVSLWWESC